jgi:hypothetical protein
MVASLSKRAAVAGVKIEVSMAAIMFYTCFGESIPRG